ncbi:MAG TPA: sigma-70 family RNA polymerase sigma factor, partial [Planctomycetota bacterium]|nr:sigma-70 family RNA polymerase sigma factor [Planctomycetota bacterium]
MTPPRENPGIERALDELGWLRALANDLCADPHTADDAVQETLTAALEHRPDLDRPVRGWLATVLTNVLRARRRAARRRAVREGAVAVREAAPSSSAVAERVELQQMLLQAVHDLPEPLRATVVLRYLDEQPPRRIAARQGVPVATVKARLRRGLAELRRRLDARHGGDRRAWLAALAAYQPLVGTILMSKQVVLGIGAMLVLLFVLCVQLGTDAPAALPATGPAASVVAEPGRLVDGAPGTNERSTLASAPASVVPPGPAVAGERVGGIVVDAFGRALAGVAVRAEGGTARTTTDAAGHFEWPASSSRIHIDEPGWTTVFAGVGRLGGRTSIVVAAPAIEVHGNVVAKDGLPVAGARVALELPNKLRGALPFVLDDSELVEHQTETHADGAFALPVLPAVEGALLRASQRDFASAAVPLPMAGDPSLRITLEGAATPARSLAGMVVDATGRPVGGALVVLGDRSTGSAADGSFALDVGGFGHASVMAREMVAVAKGSLPARVQAIGVDAAGAPQWPRPLVLTLGGPALAIAGIVRNADGSPAKARVWVNALTYLGRRFDPVDAHVVHHCYLENELRGCGDGWQPVRTDAEGRFRIDGLCAHDYHVTAMSDETVLRVDVEHVGAGREDVELRFDAAALLEGVHGRVTDRAGRPLADIRVRATTDAYEQWRDGYRTGAWMESGACTTTDAEGRFVLGAMPKQRVYLRFDGDDVLPQALGQDAPTWPFPPAQELHVAMARRCHFRVELLDATLADELEVLDASGAAVRLSEFQGRGSSMSGVRFGIVEGR